MAQFKGFSYDEYTKPLEHLQKVHNETLADMNNMSSQSDILDYYLDPERDKQSYALYNNFKQEFNKQADDFARNGLTRSNGMNLLRLHRNYNNNVANVLDALKNKKTEEAAQMATQEKNNGQMVYSSYAHDKSVDDYLRGKMGYREQNLDEVHKFAKNEAAAASGREYTDNIANAVKALGNMYYHIRTQRGFNNRQAYDIINGLMQDAENRLQWNGLDNIDSKDSPLGFIRNMRAELQKRGIENYSNEDQDKIIDAFLTGTYEGLKLDITNDFKDTPEMRKVGRNVAVTNVYTGDKVKTNPTKYNRNTQTIKNLFHDNSNDTNRQSLYNDLTSGNSVYIKHIVDAQTNGGGAIDRLLNPTDAYNSWVNNMEKLSNDPNSNIKKDSKGYYTNVYKKTSDGGSWEKEYITNDYANLIRTLKNDFYCSDEDIERMKTSSIQEVLNEKMQQIQEWKNGSFSEPSFELKIDGTNADKAISSTWFRGGSGKTTGGYTGLGFNPQTGEYSFSGNVQPETLLNFLKSEQALQQGCVIQILYAPIKKDLYQVSFTSSGFSKDGDSVETVYFPLSAFASASGSEEAEALHEAAIKAMAIQKKIEEYIANNDPSLKNKDLALQLKIANIQRDTIEKELFGMAAERNTNSEKDLKDSEYVDLNTMQPIKTKQKTYNE